MIQVNGNNGETLVFDGATIAKFRHEGRQEASRNLASTFRDVQVKPKKRKGDAEQEYDVLIACAAFFSLTVKESERDKLDELIGALRQAAGADAQSR